MEVWLDIRSNSEIVERDGIDRTFAGEEKGIALICIDDGDSQSAARSVIGMVEWLVLEFKNWSMIPLENLVAVAQGSGTKIAACIENDIQAQGAAFALEKGVDALVVEKHLLDAALISKSQRGEIETTDSYHIDSGSIELAKMKITEVREGGVGDRVCIDLTEMMQEGEGMLCSSTSQSLALIHSETIDSSYVPTRPFRVNAGSAQSYVMMADGTTKYLCELSAGDNVLVVSSQGACRSAMVGRVKIERRPFILCKWIDGNANEGVAFIQQAETVRLVGIERETIPVTEIGKGDIILGTSDEIGRHIGLAIGGQLVER